MQHPCRHVFDRLVYEFPVHRAMVGAVPEGRQALPAIDPYRPDRSWPQLLGAFLHRAGILLAPAEPELLIGPRIARGRPCGAAPLAR
jgi:hypothetical protein